MEYILFLLAAIGWLAIGWLPTRIMKHYFVTRFGAVLGDDAWNDDALCVFMTLTGPMGAVGTLIARATMSDKRVPWGWMW